MKRVSLSALALILAIGVLLVLFIVSLSLGAPLR